MITVNLGTTPEDLNHMKSLVKEFRESPLGKWYSLNINVWIQKVNQETSLSGDQYRGIIQTLMEMQLMMAPRGKIESFIDEKLKPKEKGAVDSLFETEKFKQKVLKT